MHRVHGDIHVVGLQDGCEACAEHAEKLVNLDTGMITALCERNWHYRFGASDEIRASWMPRSITEARAMANVTNLWEQMGRILEQDESGSTVVYLRRRWKLPIQFRLGE